VRYSKRQRGIVIIMIITTKKTKQEPVAVKAAAVALLPLVAERRSSPLSTAQHSLAPLLRMGYAHFLYIEARIQ
jgi:hypothetical protein